MIRPISIFLSILLLLPLTANATYEKSREQRFHLWVPDRCETTWNEDLQPILRSGADDILVMVYVSKAKKGNSYTYKNNILKSKLFSQPDLYYVQKAEPWYNLLRHSRIAIERNDDGYFVAHRIDYRQRTLFHVKVLCDSTALKDAVSVVESFNSECTTNSYFKIMLSNLTFYLGTSYVTLLPLFGASTKTSRRRWTRSAKKDRMALFQMIASIIASLLLLGLMVFCLKECIPLAVIIGIVSILIWLCFFFDVKFIKHFFSGFFS